MNIPYSLLIHTATFNNGTEATDDNGSTTLSYATGGVSVRCRIQGDTSEEGLQWFRNYGKNLYTVFLPNPTAAGITPAHDCQITFGSLTLRVLGPGYNPAGADVLQVLKAESWEGVS